MRKTPLAVFIFAAALHGIILFFVSVDYQNRALVEQGEKVPFKLVNIDIINVEGATPPKLSKSATRETVPPPRTRAPEQKDPEQQESAENFIEIEEDRAEEPVVSGYEENPVEEPATERYASDGEEEKTNGEGELKTGAAHNSTLASEYVRRNFDYISRRIRSKLVYPAQARRTGLDGIVEVLFTLNTDGSVSGVAVKKSAGAEILDESAIAAIKSAAPFRAPPVSTKLLVPVVFNLRQ
ncbi:MAG: TonB family protein [Spirochaetaceae bacterium]|nr:TonB family protein [Spirochaetaceae bacterium]